jgi:hypothetical protein
MALTVTNCNDRVEAEAASAFYDLRDAIDRDELVFEIEFC